MLYQVAALSDEELNGQGFKPEEQVLEFKRGLQEWQNTGNSSQNKNKKSVFAAAVPLPNDLPLESALSKYGLAAYAPALNFLGITNMASLRYATASDEYSNHKNQADSSGVSADEKQSASTYLAGEAGMKPLDAWQLQRCAFNEPPLPIDLPGSGKKAHQSTWPTKAAMVAHVTNLELEACAASLTSFEGYHSTSDPDYAGTLDQVMAHELDLAAAHNYTIPLQAKGAAAPTP